MIAILMSYHFRPSMSVAGLHHQDAMKQHAKLHLAIRLLPVQPMVQEILILPNHLIQRIFSGDSFPHS
jgi:hypothetical protein